MKITVIGIVKNSADIIEAFVRCNSNFADNFIIIDNFSTDRTREILNCLKEEGFDIEIIDDEENGFHQSIKMNKLLRYAIEKYNSDYVVALDDDEILVSSSDRDVVLREQIEKLPTNELHYVRWKMYIPTEYDNANEICMPLKLKYRMDDQFEAATKIIIPKQIVDDSFHIGEGHHFAEGNLITRDSYVSDIRVAHYPIRSEEQIKSKAMIGWTNRLRMKDRKPNQSVHWKAYYDHIKNGGSLSIENLQLMILAYYESWDIDRINIISDPIDLPEKCFEVRYTTGHEINALRNYMTHVEGIIEEYKNR